MFSGAALFMNHPFFVSCWACSNMEVEETDSGM